MKNKVILTLLAAFMLLGVLPLEARERSARSADRNSRSEVRRSSSQRVHRSRPRVVVNRYYSSGYRSGYYYRGSYGYYNGYYGRRYGRYYIPTTGIRFHMELVPEKDRKMAKRGIVVVDGSEQGIVDRHDSWQNGSIPVSPGEHKIQVELEDSRVFETEVVVQPGQVLHVYLRFPPPEIGK